jgi:glutamate-ammonia-ligase adenylyltransferase
MTPLGGKLQPCGPVVDAAAAERTRETILAKSTPEQAQAFEAAWPALAPVFAASPYLAGLCRHRPASLHAALACEPDAALQALLTAARAAPADADPPNQLRRLKADLHLLTALCDLGGVWGLDAVTGALTAFADAATQAALVLAAREELARGALTSVGEGAEGPLPGFFCIAMGKHGAFELNYSSDIDISLFYEPEAMPLAEGIEHQAVARRIAQSLIRNLQDRTGEGYVFRVDLRLRPDPSSTPPAVPVEAALEYYESVGQNWERAAHIKARIVAGDIARGEAFLAELQPFIWRRNLDFAAIADIHSIKRQIHAHKVDERLEPAGHDLKLGRGGIREIEFFVQTQQLILGGRHPELRSPRTLDALAALCEAGHVTPRAAADLAAAYVSLRAWEHRVQMIADEQTHRLPEAPAARSAIGALAGFDSLKAFDAAVGKLLITVNTHYGVLFAGEEALSSRFGSLVFTGVEDDPETLATLKRMGFTEPARVAHTIRSWHHGRIAATRTARGRELFTRLAPRLLEACNAVGAPDVAFRRFEDFFGALSSGVQIQSLFLAQPRLLELLVQVLAYAPKLATTLARQSGALDALLDPAFFDPVSLEAQAAAGWKDIGFEAAMDIARRFHREQQFRIGVQVMGGQASAADTGRAFADLADVIVGGLAPAALAEVLRVGGDFAGEVAVVALGKCGSREMTARSDLDLMTLYRADDPQAASATKGWAAETVYGRFTQRLTAALSAPTAEGGLYEVDLQLRPSGTQGPVAVSFKAFEDYYAREAETWELLAMTRARIVWATSPAFAAEATAAIERALRKPHDRAAATRDVLEMRALMERERPPSGFWDLKLSPGGLVDIEFVAQHLQLTHAAEGGPLRPNTAEALAELRARGMADPAVLAQLQEAWSLQQNLTQLLKVALEDDADPDSEPVAFQTLLARAGGEADFKALKRRLTAARTAARKAYLAVVK